MPRIPKSINHHKEKGNYRPGKHERAPLGYVLDDLTPPLPLEGDALIFWERIMPEMNARHILRPEDLHLYAHAAALWGIIATAYKEMQKDGYTGIGSTGNPAPSANWRVFAAAQGQFNELCTKLGIGPYGRLKLQLNDRQEAAEGPPKVNLN